MASNGPTEEVAPNTIDGARAWFQLDPSVTFLNHGSFGAVPVVVEAEASQWRRRLEAKPIEMLGRAMGGLLGEVRDRVGAFLGCGAQRVGLVTNATSGVGAVLSSIDWRAGDGILLSNHGYNAVRQAVQRTCQRWGTECTIADLPLPVSGPDEVVERIMGCVGPRTRLVIVDHITSPTALVLPVAEIAAECRARGLLCLVDGAHGPGMVPLAIDALGADWYTGNLHKWVCGPKGAAVLVASQEMVSFTHPETTSHFHGNGFVEEFAWQGTRDFANWLAIPSAIDFITTVGGGAAMAHNRALAKWAHDRLARAWKVEPISPDDGSMLGSMATVGLPPSIRNRFASAAALQARLYEHHNIEVPVIDFGGRWHVRVSAQIYNEPADYLALESAVLDEAP